ncbi:hypothetical protein J2T12_004365 [Paenibacillus anaericanus]|nr:hypothetical protein [Paenibacillus anaericanus]
MSTTLFYSSHPLGKMLDQSLTSLQLNPIVTNDAAYIYSNIFAVLSLLIVAVVVLYRYQFRTSTSMSKKNAKDM